MVLDFISGNVWVGVRARLCRLGFEKRIKVRGITTASHTHEDLATKRDVDARFDRVEERMTNLEFSFTSNMTQLNSSIASLNNTIVLLSERVANLEEGQR